jgi:hypothetical protein
MMVSNVKLGTIMVIQNLANPAQIMATPSQEATQLACSTYLTRAQVAPSPLNRKSEGESKLDGNSEYYSE